MTPERIIQAQILQAFATRPDLRLWRANTGAAFNAAGHMTRFGVRGQADLSGIIRGGIRLEIEVKSELGKQREEQKRFGDMITRFGGVYVVARSVDDVRVALAPFLGGVA